MNLERLRKLTARLSGQVVSEEFASLTVHRRGGKWVAAVEGGGKGVLLSSPHSAGVILRWHLPVGERFPRHHHPYGETLVVEAGHCLVNGSELGPGDHAWIAPEQTHECEAIKEDTVFLVIWDRNSLKFEGG